MVTNSVNMSSAILFPTR